MLSHLVWFCGACGLSLPFGAVVRLACYAGSCLAILPCVVVCYVGLFSVVFCAVVGGHVVLSAPPPSPPRVLCAVFFLCVGCAAPPPPGWLWCDVLCLVVRRVVWRCTLWCVLCFAWCCVACLRRTLFLLRAPDPCCRCLVPRRGLWLCSVLGCGAALLWCAACHAVCCSLHRVLLVGPCCFVRAAWCCVLLPVVAGCSVLGLVACCCFSLACIVAGAPAWPCGLLPYCVLWFVVVPRSPVLCPVFCGAVLPCGAVLWRPAVRFPLLVVLVCVLSLCLWCYIALRIVLFRASLVCTVVGASCCGVSLCVVVSRLAFCGVVVVFLPIKI